MYSAFGKIVRIENSAGADITTMPMVENFYTFTGREYDKESGLYYYRARYLDSETGRFIQSDPHPRVKSAPSSLVNKYIYSGNSPFMYRDPSGKMAPLLAILIVAVVAAATEAALREVFHHENGKSWFQNFSSSAIRNFIVGAAIYYGGPTAGSEGLALSTEFGSQAVVEAFKIAFENPMGKLEKQYNKQSKDNKVGVAYLGVSDVFEGQASAWLKEFLSDGTGEGAGEAAASSI